MPKSLSTESDNQYSRVNAMQNKEVLAALRMLEDARRSSLLEIIEKHPHINREKLAEITSRDKIDVAADIQVLISVGLVSNHGFGDAANYELTERGQKILEALREGDINHLEE